MDEVMTLLMNNGTAELLDKVNARAKLINQDMINTGAQPDYSSDVNEMKKQGKVWDGYRWV